MNPDIPDSIQISGDGPVRTVTLNRPDQRNAVDHPMHSALSAIWPMLAREPNTRAVILTGAGRAFCAGGDMSLLDLAAGDSEQRYQVVSDARRIATELAQFPIPVVAAVNGPAIGLGFSLAVLCDLVIMSEDAYFADPHVSLGLVAADGAGLCWPLLGSLLKAKEYLLTGDRIDATTTERIGLANRVVPADQLMSVAAGIAGRLAAQPPRAVRDTKRLLNIHLQRAVNATADFAFAAESETFALPETARWIADRRQSAAPR